MWIVGLAAGATPFGLALGSWNGAAVDSGPETGGRIMAGLGELASTWVLTAVIVGVVAAFVAKRVALDGRVSVTAAVVAGSWSLFIATLAYYHTTGALLGVADVTALPRYVLVWLVVAPAVGAVFGALAAVWVNDRNGRGGRWASVALSSTIAGEAFFSLSNPWANDEQVTINLHRCLLIAGIAIGALAAPAGSRVRTVGTTIALSWPIATVIAHAYSLIY